jgi:hypothetical protein
VIVNVKSYGEKKREEDTKFFTIHIQRQSFNESKISKKKQSYAKPNGIVKDRKQAAQVFIQLRLSAVASAIHPIHPSIFKLGEGNFNITLVIYMVNWTGDGQWPWSLQFSFLNLLELNSETNIFTRQKCTWEIDVVQSVAYCLRIRYSLNENTSEILTEKRKFARDPVHPFVKSVKSLRVRSSVELHNREHLTDLELK